LQKQTQSGGVRKCPDAAVHARPAADGPSALVAVSAPSAQQPDPGQDAGPQVADDQPRQHTGPQHQPPDAGRGRPLHQTKPATLRRRLQQQQ